jgi:hypothetical protein
VIRHRKLITVVAASAAAVAGYEKFLETFWELFAEIF